MIVPRWMPRAAPLEPAAVIGVGPVAAALGRRLQDGPEERLTGLQGCLLRRREHGPALLAHLEQFTLPKPDTLLGQIRAQTLILWGRSDKVIPVAHAHLLDAAIPHSETIIYDDVGHVPQEETASQSLADVSEFLGSQ